LNPVPENEWKFTSSIKMIRRLMKNRMYPITIEGLTESIETLKRPLH